VITFQNDYAVHLKRSNLIYNSYVVGDVTVPTTIGMVRFVLVNSPMEHDYIVTLHDKLVDVGIVLPLLDMVNHGIRNLNLMHSRAARQWSHLTPYDIKCNTIPGVNHISSELIHGFGRLLSYPGITCIAVDYSDGDLLLEVRRVIRFDTLNHYESHL
jgi:hypothetical protein